MTVMYRPLRVVCDGGCETELDAEEDLEVSDFYDLKEAIDSDGWTTRRIDRKYMHFCPDCGDPAG